MLPYFLTDINDNIIAIIDIFTNISVGNGIDIACYFAC